MSNFVEKPYIETQTLINNPELIQKKLDFSLTNQEGKLCLGRFFSNLTQAAKVKCDRFLFYLKNDHKWVNNQTYLDAFDREYTNLTKTKDKKGTLSEQCKEIEQLYHLLKNGDIGAPQLKKITSEFDAVQAGHQEEVFFHTEDSPTSFEEKDIVFPAEEGKVSVPVRSSEEPIKTLTLYDEAYIKLMEKPFSKEMLESSDLQYLVYEGLQHLVYEGVLLPAYQGDLKTVIDSLKTLKKDSSENFYAVAAAAKEIAEKQGHTGLAAAIDKEISTKLD